MAYGFEIRGPGGGLWLSSNDMIARALNTWRLYGTSGTLYHSKISPGTTFYTLSMASYYPISGSAYGKTASVDVTINNGSISWNAYHSSYGSDSALDLAGDMYLTAYTWA